MLRVEGLTVAYGAAVAVADLDLSAAAGTTLALLGRNGAGKTTTLRALAGHLRPRAGRISIEGVERAGVPAHRLARIGLAHTPESRGPLPSLTVEEQLRLAAAAPQTRPSAAPFDLGAAYALFPRLAERRDVGGGRLSGGEQQMLALARALMRRPRLLLLDEPTEGLAPAVAEELAGALSALRAPDRAIVLAAQNPRFSRALADQAVVLGKGRAVWRGAMADLAADPALAQRWLGASAGAARPPV